MSAHNQTLEKLRVLQSGKPARDIEEPSNWWVNDDPRAKAERFALKSHILGIISEDIFSKDKSGYKLSGDHSQAKTPCELAVWMMDGVKDRIEDVCQTNQATNSVVDRLYALTMETLEAHQQSGLKMPKNLDTNRAAIVSSALQTENFALGLEKSARVLNFMSNYYGLEIPQAEDLENYIQRRAIADIVKLAGVGLSIQDYFNDLENIFLQLVTPADTTENPQQAFATGRTIATAVWLKMHDQMIRPNVTEIPGSKPKGLYEISTDNGRVIGVSPRTEVVAKRLNNSHGEMAIGCAVGLHTQNVVEGPRRPSLLRLGLAATARALVESGYYQRSPEYFYGRDPELTTPKFQHLDVDFASTMLFLKKYVNQPS